MMQKTLTVMGLGMCLFSASACMLPRGKMLEAGAATQPARRGMPSRFVAHAMGEIDSKPYMNCREAFEANYRRGYRCFEVDMMFTSDGALVCLHDNFEERMGLPKPFTRREFVECKPAGKYTGLTAEDLVGLMAQKKDWFLVTDVKDDNERALTVLLATARARGVDAAARIIPQIGSHPKELVVFGSLSWPGKACLILRPK